MRQTTKVRKANLASFFFSGSNRFEKTTPVCPSETAGILCCTTTRVQKTSPKLTSLPKCVSLCGCTKLKAVSCTEMAGCSQWTHKQRVYLSLVFCLSANMPNRNCRTQQPTCAIVTLAEKRQTHFHETTLALAAALAWPLTAAANIKL